jgi:lipoprotein signal peptidase
VSERRLALVAATVALAAVDLAQKASEPVYGHPRSELYAVGAAALVGMLVAFVPRVPSLPLSLAGGVAAAGALGNGISALVWRGGVPNPILAGTIAFNVADVCAVAGAAALVLGAAAFALRHPQLLRQPI